MWLECYGTAVCAVKVITLYFPYCDDKYGNIITNIIKDMLGNYTQSMLTRMFCKRIKKTHNAAVSGGID